MRWAVLVAVALLAACPGPVTATVVTVEARASVRDARTLEVTFANEGATLTRTFDLDGRAFPVTFSVETPDRTGEVAMTARALDADGVLVGLGTASATIVADELGDATLQLDPADFAVNTSVAGSQKLAWFADAGGTQIGAGPDGTFTVGFTDDCGTLGRCDVWGRRFDVDAAPVATEIQASDQQFNLNRTDVFGNDPALAVGADGSLVAAWTTLDELLAVVISPSGAATASAETSLSAGTSPGNPAVAALPGGRFVVVWVETDPATGNRRLLGRFVDSAGVPVPNPETGSSAAFRIDTAGDPPDSPVAAVGADLSMGFAWRSGGSVRARFTSGEGLLEPQDEVVVISYGGGDAVWSPRIAASGSRFLVAWAHRGAGAPDGEIVTRTVATPTGGAIRADAVVARGVTNVTTRFGLAGQAGSFEVAWEACGSDGDGDGCGVHARAFRATGLPVGDPVVVETTTRGDQTTPSVAALGDASGAYVIGWTDASGAAPDPSETGVRARLVYPEPDAAVGVLGAACDGAAPCPAGLACLAGSDGVARCHAACDLAAPRCPDGGTCTAAGSIAGCRL